MKRLVFEEEERKKCYYLSFPILGGRYSTRALNQSSPVHPVSESREGSTSITHGGQRRTEIHVFNIGCVCVCYWRV